MVRPTRDRPNPYLPRGRNVRPNSALPAGRAPTPTPKAVTTYSAVTPAVAAAIVAGAQEERDRRVLAYMREHGVGVAEAEQRVPSIYSASAAYSTGPSLMDASREERIQADALLFIRAIPGLTAEQAVRAVRDSFTPTDSDHVRMVKYLMQNPRATRQDAAKALEADKVRGWNPLALRPA